MPLDNYGVVSVICESVTLGPTRLVRSAQPDVSGFKSLYKQGVRTIIKLCSEREYPLVEEQTYFAPGVVIPDPLAGLFRFNDTEAVIAIAGQIFKGLRIGDVHVHCTHGRDRTGLVCAAYRLIYDKATLDEVNEERKSYGVDGIIALFDIPDIAILKEILRRLAAGDPFPGVAAPAH